MSLSIFLLLIFVSPSFSAFVVPITKHHVHNTPFYTLKLHLKTPPQPAYLLLHVGANFTSVDCRRNYASTTTRHVPCNSSLCHSLQSNHTRKCGLTTSQNKTVLAGCVINSPHRSFAMVGSLGLPSTDGRNPGQVRVFSEFVFTCSDESSRILKGRAKKVVAGIVGLGVSDYSLPAQVSTTSSVFALCVSGSPSAPGVAFFDLAKPYYFLPGIDMSEHLYYTPLFSNNIIAAATGKTNAKHGKANTKRVENAYFFRVKSINVNGRAITINQTLLTVDGNGKGGTRISTIDPYTVLERSIFIALTDAFKKESKTMKLRSVKAINPFKICYEADDLSETHLGPNVPEIDLVMENDVIWRVLGKNSMVRIVEEGVDVWCLAVVDGGVGCVSSMVIGGHQLEDNLLQFDMGEKRLGFSSSLLQHKTMCANFNFSTNDAIKAFN